MSYVPESARAALRESAGGEAGHALAAFALDFDRDGALSVLGGGDCAPFDAKRFPGAIDVPDNRLDEDCDGKDLTRGNILARPRSDWPLPTDFPRKPSVVLLTVDAFAARHLHALNPDKKARPVTPSLDALAKQGTLFSHCFSQGPSTRLSFPSMFTSRWDSQIEQRLQRMHPFPLEATELTLAEVMKEAGYDTTAVVSDSYFTRARWSTLLQGFVNVVETPARGVSSGSKHNSKKVTDEAIKRLVPKGGKPLFLWAHYFDAHPPHTQPSDVPTYGKQQEDRYDAELQLVDREIGRLLKEVDKQLGKDTIVIVTGDHGIGFDAPRHRRLSYGYDLSTVVLHVPLIVRGPDVKPQVLPGLVSTMDIAPTIANLVRVRKRLPFEGASLVPELFSSTAQRTPRLHHQFYLHERLWDNADPLAMVSVRTDRYNLILDRKTGVHELYDYAHDYQEAHDLSGDPAYAEVLTTLKQQLALFTYELHAPHRTAAAQLR
jgi:arylsulfatase A-like enzyme